MPGLFQALELQSMRQSALPMAPMVSAHPQSRIGSEIQQFLSSTGRG